MSDRDCNACQELRDYAPNFVQNGVNTRVANSLKANTGFNPNLSVLHNDCEDLNDANDCLIGSKRDEIEAYEVCDWKEFMRKFLGNLYEMLKAIIAAICGLWIRADRLCELNDMVVNMVNGALTAVPADETISKISFALPPEFQFNLSDAETCGGSSTSYLAYTWYVPGNVTTVNQPLARGDILARWNKSTIVNALGDDGEYIYQRLNTTGHYSSIAFWIGSPDADGDSTIVGAMFRINDDYCDLMVESLCGSTRTGETVTFHPSRLYRKIR